MIKRLQSLAAVRGAIAVVNSACKIIEGTMKPKHLPLVDAGKPA
jgi:hypothetical protein